METRIETGPGWIEVTREGLSVLAKGDDALRARLVTALESSPDDDPADVVTDELAAGGVRRAPAFAVVDEGSRRLLVRGSARARLEGEGVSREAVAPARGPWSDEDIEAGVGSITLVTGEALPPVEEPGQQAEDVADQPAADVADRPAAGTAGGPQFVYGHLVSGLLAQPEGVPGPDEEGPDEQEPEGGTPAEEVADEGEGAGREPGGVSDTGELPAGAMVLAVACVHGHLNPPDVGLCRICREEVPEQQAELAPRPPLGVLHLSTGEQVVLDRDVRLGRAPKAPEDSEEPHLVRVTSPENEISRNHAEVVLDGWRVLVRDLGSTNGTTVTPAGGTPERLHPGQEQPIGPGATIALADRVSAILEVTG